MQIIYIFIIIFSAPYHDPVDIEDWTIDWAEFEQIGNECPQK